MSERSPADGSDVDGDAAATSSDPHAEAERRRLMAKIFGDVLPDTSRDERPDGWGDTDERDEAWLRRQVPPHHGG